MQMVGRPRAHHRRLPSRAAAPHRAHPESATAAPSTRPKTAATAAASTVGPVKRSRKRLPPGLPVVPTYGSREPKIINGLRAFWRRVVEVGLGARLVERHLNADCSNRSDEVHAAPFASRQAGYPAQANLTRRFQARERRERTPLARSSVLPPAIDLGCPAIRHSWRAQVEDEERADGRRGPGGPRSGGRGRRCVVAWRFVGSD